MEGPDKRVEMLWAETCEVDIPPTCPTCVLGIARTNNDLADPAATTTCSAGHTFQVLDVWVIWTMVFACAGRLMMQAVENTTGSIPENCVDWELWELAYKIHDWKVFWPVGTFCWGPCPLEWWEMRASA